MENLFPWEVPEITEDLYSGPCLFKALHRLYKNAYYGQGFQLSGKFISDKNLKKGIDRLPLDIKRIIFEIFWEHFESKKGFVVKNGDLLLDFSLQYLFSQYGKLKAQTKSKIPRGYAC